MATEYIRYEVNKADVKRVMKKLKGVEHKAPRVFKNAVNRTATRTKRVLAAGMQAAYTVKAGGLNSRMKIQRASPGYLTATIKVRGRTMTLTRYHTTMPKSGGRAEVVQGNGLRELAKGENNHAFKHNGLMMQRKGAERYPLKALRSNSVPKMIEKVYDGTHSLQGDMQPLVQRWLHDELGKELKKLTG